MVEENHEVVARQYGLSGRIAPGLVLGVLLALVVLANLNVLDNQFLNWDDRLLLTANSRVQVDSWAGFWRIFDPSDALAGRHLEWLPLRDALYGLTFFFFGLDPLPYHVLQIVFHAAVVVLLHSLARGWIGDRGALIAAALFAVHPIHVESVAWAAALKDPTFTAALLLAILLYQRSLEARGGRRIGLYAGAVLAALAALGFKQIAIVLPGLLLLVDWTFLRRRLRPAIADKLPFLAVVVAVLPLFVAIGRKNAVIIAPPGGSAFTGFLTMTTVYADYFGKLIAPFDLSARYVVTPVMTAADPRFLLAAVTIVALWGGALLAARRTRLPLFALAWFTIGLLPVMNILPIPIEMADRYLYLPSIGAAVAAGAGLATLTLHPSRAIAIGARLAAAGVLVLFAVGSMRRNEVWQDDVTLWTSVVGRSPEFTIGRTNLAEAYLARGDLVAAERELRAAIATNPRYATALLNLGMVLRTTGRTAEARSLFEQAVRERPDYPKAYNNLAALLMDEQRWSEARVVLERMLARQPDYPIGQRNLAVVCSRLGDHAAAVKHMRRAIDARPADRALFLEWLALLESVGRGAEARSYRDRVERRFGNDAEVRTRFGRLLQQAGHAP
jgi:Tfp pilus assembly protein PilF